VFFAFIFNFLRLNSYLGWIGSTTQGAFFWKGTPVKKIMKFMSALIVGLATTLVQAEGLAGISTRDASDSVKEALTTGAKYAVSALGKENGFLGNSKVRIPLPDPLNRIEGLMRTLGMGRQADELTDTMNHGAESAVAQAGPILMDFIKKISVKDAKDILTGGEDSVSQYFRRTSSDALTQKFRPIVKRATQKVQLGEKYNNIAGKATSAGPISTFPGSQNSTAVIRGRQPVFVGVGRHRRVADRYD